MVQSNRKLQISNGYLFESDQLSRVLHFLAERPAEKRIYRKDIQESTGLSNRQIESVVSIGCALGLIKPGVQTLTATGALITEHDIFLEQTGTLQWCHYQGAGNSRNLVWYEIFNRILPAELAHTESGWLANLRNSLSGQYTERTIGKHLQQEVRFVIDAYLNRNFKKLEILQQHSDGRLYRRRHLQVEPPILCAMIYDYATGRGESLLQVREIPSEAIDRVERGCVVYQPVCQIGHRPRMGNVVAFDQVPKQYGLKVFLVGFKSTKGSQPGTA